MTERGFTKLEPEDRELLEKTYLAIQDLNSKVDGLVQHARSDKATDLYEYLKVRGRVEVSEVMRRYNYKGRQNALTLMRRVAERVGVKIRRGDRTNPTILIFESAVAIVSQRKKIAALFADSGVLKVSMRDIMAACDVDLKDARLIAQDVAEHTGAFRVDGAQLRRGVTG